MSNYDWFSYDVEPAWIIRRREAEEARIKPIIDLGYEILVLSAPASHGTTHPVEVYVCQSCTAIITNPKVHRGVCDI